MIHTIFPKQHANGIRTTNMMEWVNKELQRRTMVVGSIPRRSATSQAGWGHLDGEQRGGGDRQKAVDDREGMNRQGDTTQINYREPEKTIREKSSFRLSPPRNPVSDEIRVISTVFRGGELLPRTHRALRPLDPKIGSHFPESGVILSDLNI